MDTEKNDLKFKALESSVYCPPFKEEKAIKHIELDGEFDVEKIKAEVRRSVSLLSYQVSYRPLILEILDILDQNSPYFLVDKQKHITFYWSGILVLRIDVKKEDIDHDKQLHVSLQKYKVEKTKLLEDKKRLVEESKSYTTMMMGFGGSMMLAGLVAGFTIFNKIHTPER
jgi:hypothetical protein